MRVLVTGATGFIGRKLVGRLSDQGADVVGLAIDAGAGSPSYEASIVDSDPQDNIIALDLRQAEATTKAVALAQPDRVIHLAAAGVADPTIDPYLALHHNVHGTINLFQACFDNQDLAPQPRQLIVIRTPGETKPANAYVASKAAAWSFCQMFARRSGWPIVGAKIFQAYGPGQPGHTFIQASLRAALAGEDFAMTSGEQIRDWIYAGDVVDGLMAILGRDLSPGESVDLGTGRATSLLTVAKEVYQLVGRGGQPSPGALPDRTGEEINQVADITRTNHLLAWTPQISLEDGLRLVLESLVT